MSASNVDWPAPVLLVATVGGLLSGLIAGPIVDNLSLGSDYYDCAAQAWQSVNDFKIPFFIQDGICLLMIIIVFFFLDIKVSQNKGKRQSSLRREFSWLLNPAAIVFYLSCLMFGMMFGAYDTFFPVFAQETLNATTSFLGYTFVCQNAASIMFLLVARPVLSYLGPVNLMCLVSLP